MFGAVNLSNVACTCTWTLKIEIWCLQEYLGKLKNDDFVQCMFVRNFDNCELINLFVAILCWLHKFKCSFIFLNLSSLLIYTFTFLYFNKCLLYYESFASSAFRKLVLCILNDGFRRTAPYKKRMKKYIKLLHLM